MNPRFEQANNLRFKAVNGEIKRILHYLRKQSAFTFTVYLDRTDHLVYVRNTGRYAKLQREMELSGAFLVGVYTGNVREDYFINDVKEALDETLRAMVDLTWKYNL